jgi:DNA primase
MAFQKDWVPLFDGCNVTIMFDNDDAGIRGAVKTAFMFRKFTYRWVPPRFGKDVSDVLINYDQEMLKVLMRSEDNKLDVDIPDFKSKKEMREYRRELLMKARGMTAGSIGTYFIRALIVELSVRLAERKHKPVQLVEGSDLERAKSYPIENLIKVNRNGFALCVTHKEKTPSLKVYKDNHAYCFGGCGKRFDAIAIAMAVWNCDFKSAVERLTK